MKGSASCLVTLVTLKHDEVGIYQLFCLNFYFSGKYLNKYYRLILLAMLFDDLIFLTMRQQKKLQVTRVTQSVSAIAALTAVE